MPFLKKHENAFAVCFHRASSPSNVIEKKVTKIYNSNDTIKRLALQIRKRPGRKPDLNL